MLSNLGARSRFASQEGAYPGVLAAENTQANSIDATCCSAAIARRVISRAQVCRLRRLEGVEADSVPQLEGSDSRSSIEALGDRRWRCKPQEVAIGHVSELPPSPFDAWLGLGQGEDSPKSLTLACQSIDR